MTIREQKVSALGPGLMLTQQQSMSGYNEARNEVVLINISEPVVSSPSCPYSPTAPSHPYQTPPGSIKLSSTQSNRCANFCVPKVLKVRRTLQVEPAMKLKDWGNRPWTVNFRAKSQPLPESVDFAVIAAVSPVLPPAAWLKRLARPKNLGPPGGRNLWLRASGHTGGMPLLICRGELPDSATW